MTQEDLGDACQLSRMSISRLQKKFRATKFEGKELLFVRSGKNSNSWNEYFVDIKVLMNLFPGPPKRSMVPSDFADMMAQHFHARSQGIYQTPKNGHNKYRTRARKNWERTDPWTFQSWLDAGRTEEEIELVVEHAFDKEPQATAKRGPRTLKKKFDRFLAAARARKSIASLPTLDVVVPVDSTPLPSKAEAMDILQRTAERSIEKENQ